MRLIPFEAIKSAHNQFAQRCFQADSFIWKIDRKRRSIGQNSADLLGQVFFLYGGSMAEHKKTA